MALRSQGVVRPLLLAAALAIATLAGFAVTAPRAEPANLGADVVRARTELGADAVWAWWWPTAAALVREVEGYGFSRVYLYTEAGFGRKVRAAIAALDARGIAVEALGGEQRWATTQRAGMLGFVRSATRYQRRAPPSGRLDGIHLDVEPYGLTSWRRDPEAVAASLVRSLKRARRAAGGLPLTADMPYWFDRVSSGHGSLAKAVIAATDATTVMAYRDSGPEVIVAARREVRIADRLGRRTTVGVETDEVRPASVTFHEEGTAALTGALAEIRARFAGERGFGGTAVHHLGSLPGLKP